MAPVVAIASKNREFYLSLLGENTHEYNEFGSGKAETRNWAQAWEFFLLHYNDDGSVSFESQAFPNVYLRLSGHDNTVNAQFGAREWEKFNIVRKPASFDGYAGAVGIKSKAFPGKFLSIASDGAVRVAEGFGQAEEFEIVVIT
ncbi:hypothetical protein BGX38DRAFT_1211476 [Terfezia claveryi]|nr:hypothetical protein BGX38DRAFT_1211476 [Terfezia claveryi]